MTQRIVSRRTAACLGLFPFLLLASVQAHAVGTLEINQACVATGCFAGDGPSFAVAITAASRRDPQGD